MRLENKVALISGGARGMGATEARMFAREGCKVVIGDLRDELGRQVEAEINELGGECLYVHLDVTDEQAWKDAVAAAVERFGKLDILVNNAGVYMPERVENTTNENWDVTMSVNAKGVFLGTKAAIPEMRRNGGGSIVNISSVAGLVGNHISSAYTASKGAVRLFTKTVAMQHARDGIRCNSIHPGPIETDMLKEAFGLEREARTAMIPLGYVGSTEDIAYGVLYLASDESSFVTGSELVIDGGFTAQ
jgi:NAD(P)-dependent dehydrogenase (short-subunit alcohol dehydrogenase family)